MNKKNKSLKSNTGKTVTSSQCNTYTHLSLDDRAIIQQMLNVGASLHQIALALNRSDSTIADEIKRHRILSGTQTFAGLCSLAKTCTKQHICADSDCRRFCVDCAEACHSNRCPDYLPKECPRIAHAPYVCNGCHKKNCHLVKYLYKARIAQTDADETLRSSRIGINLTPEQMQRLDALVSPLLLNGQSIRAIYLNHGGELPCSERTLYKYVDKCYLTARNMDMPRKIRFKQRNSHPKRTAGFTDGRTYAAFQNFLSESPDISVCEMDTVIGRQGGKCILTLTFRSCNFLIALLLESKTQQAVVDALNQIHLLLGHSLFRRAFGVILTDRGTEFACPELLEQTPGGKQKTKVFYCDPYCSWQKGCCERNHEFIRAILPKGTSFDRLSQLHISRMADHINSYPRDSIDGIPPFLAARQLFGKQFLNKLTCQPIPPDEVVLKEKLLKAFL